MLGIKGFVDGVLAFKPIHMGLFKLSEIRPDMKTKNRPEGRIEHLGR